MEKWTRALFQPGIPLGEDGRRVTASPSHITLSKEAAKEGMVLLKNEEGTLPLKPGANVALFGKATFDYVKGGGGSGDVTVPYVRNLYDGFCEINRREREADRRKREEAGFLSEQDGENFINIYEPLADFYRDYVRTEYEKGTIPGLVGEPYVPEKLLDGAAEFADSAVISICRFSGEGADRAEEDFYLTKSELRMVRAVAGRFARVIVVLNIGSVISTEWFRNEKSIQAALVAWQGGMEGGLAAAELLCGIGNPSGKLTDTFAGEISDYPSTASFRESKDYVEYTEDIYVGYRYFETIPGAREKVAWPFGYGLSYTTFQIECTGAYINPWNAPTFELRITNTGNRPGRETVQLYGNVPDGALGNPRRQLVDFCKIPELAPGDSFDLRLSAPITLLTSYDDVGAIEESCWVLEQGPYLFYVGADVRSAKEIDITSDLCSQERMREYYRSHGEELWILRDGTFCVASDRVMEKCSRKLSPAVPLRRMDSNGAVRVYDGVVYDGAEEDKTAKHALTPLKWEEMECVIPATRGVGRRCFLRQEEKVPQLIDVWRAGEPLTLSQFVRSLTDRELAELLGGQPNTGVANTFGIGNLPRYGVPNIMTADGPAGLRVEKRCGVTATAWPCATLLACTWDPELVAEVGRAAAKEVKENNIGVWLAPAVNIHRNPLCGRNFEYYSEDPLLAGRIGAGMVRGIQSQKVAATVKHFALNNKEENRKESDSRASERAIREIYLKAFEIIVKEAHPWAIMSSYNKINGVRASERQDMLTGILRDEWGYDGVVMTDWWAFSEEYREILAGNDLKMGCGYPERLLEAMEKGLISRADLERAATRVLELILKID